MMISGIDALKRLQDGNHRYVSDNQSVQPNPTRRRELMEGQEPCAIILGCSDSRVPVEIIFDQGLGDLFVVRVAGNITTPTQVGSIEFAAQHLSSRLIVVLGHSGCAAIEVTLNELERPTNSMSLNVLSVFDHIMPTVKAYLGNESHQPPVDKFRGAIRANICASADHLRFKSKIIKELIQKNELLVVGAEYSLETGVVDFFDGIP